MKRGRTYRRENPWLRALLAALGIAALAALLYLGGRWLDTREEKPQARGDYTQRYAYEDALEVDGGLYRKRRNLTTILLMGVDREQDALAQGVRNGGQADFLRLIVIDPDAKRIEQLQIDRDTMTPITILGVLGNRSGVRTAQISLAHGFGDGREQSCELTVDAVTNLLLGTRIDHYVAMNMDGISVLNDWAGGVRVTLEDDFSAIDPAMEKGTTLTLMGDQAETFVRSRMNVGVGTNASRMKRQQLYIDQLSAQLDAMLRVDEAAVGALYDALEPYLVTNLSRGRLINEVWAARDYERAAPVQLAGSHQLGEDGFMQFIADEAALQDKVLSLFHQEVK